MASVSPRRRRNNCKSKFTTVGDHEKFLARIRGSLYYGRLPSTERLSLPVTELATELFSAAQREHSLKRLDLEEASVVSRSACVSPCSLVLALLYIERLQSCHPSYLQESNPSELYLVSLMVATKFLQDDGEDDGVMNDEWATSAGISTSHLNHLERDFLNAIDWEVFVHEEAFWTRLRGLEREVALNEGVRRGWFSYSDLDVLLEKFDYASVAHTVLSVSAVCLTSYTASVLTLIASTLLVSHLQLLVSSSGTLSQSSTSLSASTSTPMDFPYSSLDQSSASISTNATAPSHPAAVDALTTSFILASIASCQDAQGNSSKLKCIESKKQSETLSENHILTKLNLLHDYGSVVYVDSGNGSESGSWLSWLGNWGSWFSDPSIGHWVSPPVWTLSSTHPSFIPIELS